VVSKRTVLVIEDEDRLRSAICQILSDEDYRVAGAATLAEARQQIAIGDVDAMLLDLRLPDGDGDGLLAELAARDAEIAVVISSASGFEHPTEVAKKYHVRAVRKPIDLEVLLEVLAQAIEGRAFPRL